jgi:anti-sigma B factor antagonist
LAGQKTSVERRLAGGWMVVTAVGEFDLLTAPRLHSVLIEAAVSAPAGIVVDLSGVTFIDSSALGVLVGAFNAARGAERVIRFVRPDARVMRLFEITGLTKLFEFADSVEAAIADPPGEVAAPPVSP